MHVLIIPSWFDPNAPHRVSPFIFEQARALLLIGVKVGIIHAGFSGNRLSFAARQIEGIPIISATLPRGLHKTRLTSVLIRSVYLILLTRYRVRYGKASIVHAHGMYAAGISAAAVARQLRVPFVVTEHHASYSLNVLSPWQLKKVRKAARRCAAIFFVSHSLLQRSAEYLPCR